jgi:hypothetical protein
MTPTYKFILWMCLASQPQCDTWQSVKHMVFVFPSNDKAQCERQWQESLLSPDPDGQKSRYKCEPIQEDL